MGGDVLRVYVCIDSIHPFIHSSGHPSHPTPSKTKRRRKKNATVFPFQQVTCLGIRNTPEFHVPKIGFRGGFLYEYIKASSSFQNGKRRNPPTLNRLVRYHVGRALESRFLFMSICKKHRFVASRTLCFTSEGIRTDPTVGSMVACRFGPIGIKNIA